MKYLAVLLAVLGLVFAQQAMASLDIDALLSRVSMLESSLDALDVPAAGVPAVAAPTPAAAAGAPQAVVAAQPAAADPPAIVPPQPMPSIKDAMNAKPDPSMVAPDPTHSKPMDPAALAALLEQVKALLGDSNAALPPAMIAQTEGLATRVASLSQQLFDLMHPDAGIPWQEAQAKMFQTPGNPLIGDQSGTHAVDADRMSKVFKYTQNLRKISTAEVENMYPGSPDVKGK